MTTTAELSKNLSRAHESELSAAIRRETRYQANVNTYKRDVSEYLRQAAQTAKDAGIHNPVEMMSDARASKRERQHEIDAKMLRRNGIELDDIKPNK